jgi:hypothetical protein
MTEDQSRLASVLLDILKIAITLGAGVWVYFRFVRERSHAKRIAFTISCNFYGPQSGNYVAEFTIHVHNQGLVIHRMEKLKLILRGISRDRPLTRSQTHPGRLAFPEKLLDDQDVIVSERYSHVFVEPGVEQLITYVTTVPEEFSLIRARAEFEYYKAKRARTHSTESIFELPQRSM